MKRNILLCCIAVGMVLGCSHPNAVVSDKVRLLVLDPQHFHAALVQKFDNPILSNDIHLFVGKQQTLDQYLSFINEYNNRAENPTNWNVIAYQGNDFLIKAFEKDNGDVVVLAGDNAQKIKYISEAVEHGKSVFADKPLVINEDGYKLLEAILNNPDKSETLIYDMMTERYEVKNIIAKALLNNKEFSGGFDTNSKKPLISYRSVHHFIKSIGDKPVVRPSIFFDVRKQGEGLVDVTTHYIDLVQWVLSSERPINLKDDLNFIASERSSTKVTLADFKRATGQEIFPSEWDDMLHTKGELAVYSNGKINYSLLGVPVEIDVRWNVEAQQGKGDEFEVLFRPRNFELKIAADDSGKPSLFITPKNNQNNFRKLLQDALSAIPNMSNLTFEQLGHTYKISIPTSLYKSHDDHFAEVLQNFLSYRKEGKLPEWEKSFLLAKYYLTTQALARAKTVN